MLRYLNPNHIVELLREDKVPATVQLSLISVVITVQCLLGRPGLVGPLASTSSSPLVAFQLCMVLVTLWLAFKANGGPSGKAFLTRYAMLACVLYIWVNAIGHALYVLLYSILYASLGTPAIDLFRQYGPAQLAFSAITALALLLSLQHFISKVARPAA
jgi:hypothetical protein